jgi:hypothetical protein
LPPRAGIVYQLLCGDKEQAKPRAQLESAGDGLHDQPHERARGLQQVRTGFSKSMQFRPAIFLLPLSVFN